MQPALVVARRELRETLTDWRILVPMFTLALLFPVILVLGINIGLPYMSQVDATEAAHKAGLFGAVMGSFFPISFSLIIALESFSGEKERNTLEALLASPISDGEVFLGKFLAVLAPPVTLSILGLAIFSVGARTTLGLEIAPDFLALALVLSLVEALVMVAAAVVVSSQTGSVKSANLLASFIILPVALVVQGEVMLLLLGYGHMLWFIFLAFVVVGIMLLRMGIQLFSREEILTREGDTLNLRGMLRSARTLWSGLPERRPFDPREPFSLGRLYRRDLPLLLALNRGPLSLVLGFLTIGAVAGYVYSLQHPLPLPLGRMTHLANTGAAAEVGNYISVPGLFAHNLRTLTLAGLLSLVTFGAAGLVVVVLTAGSVGFLAGQAGAAGMDAGTFLLAFIAPHGVFEVPAIIVAGALNLRLGMTLMTLPKGHSLGEGLLLSGVNWVKGAALFVPLLLVAAVVEAKLTPLVMLAVLGGQ